MTKLIKIDWQFNPGIKEFFTDDFWYDLTDGGYINPDKLLLYPAQANQVKEAIAVLESFKEALEEHFGMDDD